MMTRRKQHWVDRFMPRFLAAMCEATLIVFVLAIVRESRWWAQ